MQLPDLLPCTHPCCLPTQVTELAPLALLPMFLVDSKVLQPMRMHVGGTVLAAALAVTKGWAVNIGGGMHHAHREDGSGWCPYADITLAIQRLRWVRSGVEGVCGWVAAGASIYELPLMCFRI